MKSLRIKLTKDMGKERKRRAINHAFRRYPEKREEYNILYRVSIVALDETRHVTRAYNKLELSGYIHCSTPSNFSREFQIACVAARKPLQTPSEYVRKRNETDPKKKASNNRAPAIFEKSGMRFGRLEKFLPEGH